MDNINNLNLENKNSLINDEYSKFLYINKLSLLDYKTLSCLLNYKFEEYNMNYNDMINQYKILFYLKSEIYDEKWIEYIKKLIIDYNSDMEYKKNHIDEIFKSNNIENIINNYPTLNSIVEKLNNIELIDYKNNVFSVENFDKEIFNYKNFKIYFNDFKIYTKNDKISYHIIHNNSFDNLKINESFLYFSKNSLNILISKYRNELYDFLTFILSSNKHRDIISHLINIIDKKDFIHFLYYDKMNISNFLKISLQDSYYFKTNIFTFLNYILNIFIDNKDVVYNNILKIDYSFEFDFVFLLHIEKLGFFENVRVRQKMIKQVFLSYKNPVENWNEHFDRWISKNEYFMYFEHFISISSSNPITKYFFDKLENYNNFSDIVTFYYLCGKLYNPKINLNLFHFENGKLYNYKFLRFIKDNFQAKTIFHLINIPDESFIHVFRYLKNIYNKIGVSTLIGLEKYKKHSEDMLYVILENKNNFISNSFSFATKININLNILLENIDKLSENNHFSLLIRILNKYKEILNNNFYELWCKKGFNLNVYDEEGNSPLMILLSNNISNRTKFNKYDIMKLMLNNKCDPYVKNKYGVNCHDFISNQIKESNYEYYDLLEIINQYKN